MAAVPVFDGLVKEQSQFL